jgi:hypothetical protein
MYTVTMTSWCVDKNRRIIGNSPTITQIHKDTLKEAMQEAWIMKENHDLRHATPYEIVNVTSSSEK